MKGLAEVETDEYIPTTESVRNWYANARTIYGDPDRSNDLMRDEFDAWLKTVKSEVWYESMNSVEDPHYWRESPYD